MNSLPDNESQPSSQDRIKGVPFPPKLIVSDGLEIIAIRTREGSGQSTEARKNTAGVFSLTNSVRTRPLAGVTDWKQIVWKPKRGTFFNAHFRCGYGG